MAWFPIAVKSYVDDNCYTLFTFFYLLYLIQKFKDNLWRLYFVPDEGFCTPIFRADICHSQLFNEPVTFNRRSSTFTDVLANFGKEYLSTGGNTDLQICSPQTTCRWRLSRAWHQIERQEDDTTEWPPIIRCTAAHCVYNISKYTLG